VAAAVSDGLCVAGERRCLPDGGKCPYTTPLDSAGDTGERMPLRWPVRSLVRGVEVWSLALT